MKILNGSEHRIFLSAMRREREVCKSEDFFDYDGTNKLLDICDSIERKINDAEPVVRCRDCKYARKLKDNFYGWEYSCRHFNTHATRSTDFCSYGVRKEDEANEAN